MRQQTQGPCGSQCIGPRDYRVLREFAEAPPETGNARVAQAFKA